MSSPISWSDVLNLPGAVADNLAGVPVGGQTMILAVVNSSAMLDPSAFDGEDGVITKLARCLLAGHMAYLGRQGGTAVSQSEGEVSESFALPSMDQSLWRFSSYGLLLLSLVPAKDYGFMVL